jgi:hypothetical protein
MELDDVHSVLNFHSKSKIKSIVAVAISDVPFRMQRYKKRM